MTHPDEAKIRALARGRRWPRYLVGDLLAEEPFWRREEPDYVDRRVRMAVSLHLGRAFTRLTTGRFEQAAREYLADFPDADLWSVFVFADAEATRWFEQKRRETRMSPPYRLPAPINAQP